MKIPDLRMPLDGKVDVVLCQINDFGLSKECLRLLFATTPREEFRLILVGGEHEEATIWVSQRDAVDVVAGQNQGISLAMQSLEASYLLLLEPAARIPEGDTGWLGRLVAELEEAGPQCAAVGVTSNIIDPPQQILTAPQVYTENWITEGRRGFGHNPTVPWVTGLATLFRKSAIARVGTLDTRFGPGGGYADIDYALQLREAGFTLRVARSVYVRRDFDFPKSQHWKQLRSLNRQRWYDKWGIGRLYDLKVLPTEHLKAALEGSL